MGREGVAQVLNSIRTGWAHAVNSVGEATGGRRSGNGKESAREKREISVFGGPRVGFIEGSLEFMDVKHHRQILWCGLPACLKHIAGWKPAPQMPLIWPIDEG